ncbi:MAG: RES domain-containing protein, partial [Balneolaceae bacterium]|nr:RES domain-containing protein [Balneolaceae bacterium]
VHRSGEGLNGLFRITEINVPDKASLETIVQDRLPANWHKIEMYDYCQSIGDKWIEEKKSLLLKVPSSIIRDEFNILINPNHSEFDNVEIKNISSFEFDERL